MRILFIFIPIVLLGACQRKNEIFLNYKNVDNIKNNINVERSQSLSCSLQFFDSVSLLYRKYNRIKKTTFDDFYTLDSNFTNFKLQFYSCNSKQPVAKYVPLKPTTSIAQYTTEIPVVYDSISCLSMLYDLYIDGSLYKLTNAINVVYLNYSNPNSYLTASARDLFVSFRGAADSIDNNLFLMNSGDNDAYLHLGYLFSIAGNFKIPYVVAKYFFHRPSNPVIVTDDPMPTGGSLPLEYNEIWGGLIVRVNSLDSANTIAFFDTTQVRLSYTVSQYNTYISYALDAYVNFGSPAPSIWNKADIIYAINLYYNSSYESQEPTALELSSKLKFIEQLLFYVNNYYFIIGGAQLDGTPGPVLNPHLIPS